VEKVPAGPADLIPDFEDGLLPGGPEPEMAMVHEEGHAMLFRGNGVILGDLQGLKAGDRQFDAAGGPGLGPHLAFQDQRGFQSETVKLLEVPVRELAFDQHPLDQAGAVPDYQEAYFTAGAKMMDPTPNGHQLAGMVGQTGDIGHRRRGFSLWSAVFGCQWLAAFSSQLFYFQKGNIAIFLSNPV
jgi:hypothetical protein